METSQSQINFNSEILMEFIEELMRNSNPVFLAEQKNYFQKNSKKMQEKANSARTKEINSENANLVQLQTAKQKPCQVIQNGSRKLIIPEPKLPPQLQYLKPTPAPGINLELGKLNSLIRDSAVRIIECNGPDTEISAKTINQEKKTNIILNKEEIDRIIQIFSQESKIPAEEGIFRVVVGNLIFSAIISDVIGSRFSIRKMSFPSQTMNIGRR